MDSSIKCVQYQSQNQVTSDIADIKMKRDETPLLSRQIIAEAAELGARTARLRQTRRVLQADAAARAGMSRSTAVLIEKGDPGRTLAQVMRYIDAIAPGMALTTLLSAPEESLRAAAKPVQRVRGLSKAEHDALNF